MAGSPIRAIFLDIDGCLNSPDFQVHRFQRGPGRSPIDPICVGHLNDLTARTGARIVVSSTWRRMGLGGIRRLLHKHGVTGPIVGRTPVIEHRTEAGVYVWTERGAEIQRWLDRTGFEVESFVILDDDADMAHLGDRLVQTDWRTGLTGEDVERACELLEHASVCHPDGQPRVDGTGRGV